MISFYLEKRLIRNEMLGKKMRNSDVKSLNKILDNLEWVETNNLNNKQKNFIAYDIAERIRYLHPSLKTIVPVLTTASNRVLHT